MACKLVELLVLRVLELLNISVVSLLEFRVLEKKKNRHMHLYEIKEPRRTLKTGNCRLSPTQQQENRLSFFI